MLVDTHCHLDFRQFDEDREDVLKRAGQAGVVRILNPGIDLESSRAAIELAEAHPEVFAAVGVHPNEALIWEDGTLQVLRELAKRSKVVAIGEIGLDYYRDRAPQEKQQQIFRKQLELAAETGLPVVIHTRDADGQERGATADVLDMLSEWKTELSKTNPALAERPGVLHSFSSDETAAQRAIDLNFRIGITGPVTFRNAPGLQRVVSSLPIDHLLVETDAPYLTPHPYRGQRNEPAYVRLVIEKIAQIHNLPFDRVANATSDSAERLFNW